MEKLNKTNGERGRVRGFAPARPSADEIIKGVSHLDRIAGTDETSRIVAALATKTTPTLLDAAWQLILNADTGTRRVVLRGINQRMRRNESTLVTMQVPPPVHAKLKRFAEKRNLTLGSAILVLLGKQ